MESIQAGRTVGRTWSVPIDIAARGRVTDPALITELQTAGPLQLPAAPAEV